MKRKLTALLLSAAMIVSMIPEVGAASGVPKDFYKQVGLELMPARSAGLYDEPEHPIPDVDESGFIREIEGWTPAPVKTGLPVAVTKAEEGAVEIATAEELQAITTGGSYVLTEDIDLTGVAWTPKRVSGALTLDGQGHTIKGFTLKMDAETSWGLFASVGGAFTVKNLRVDGAAMDMAITNSGQYSFIGTLAGDANTTTLQNVVVNTKITRSVSATPYIAGVVGLINGSLQVSDCAFDITIDHTEDVEAPRGGLMAGLSRSVSGTVRLERMYAKVNIDGTAVSECGIGGLIPYGAPEIRDSRIEAEVSTQLYHAGGVVAACNGGTFVMDNCVVNAVGTGSGELGGVAGKFSHGAKMELTDCRIGADLTLTGKVEAGGIAGIVDQCGAQITGCAVDTVIRTEGQDRQTTTIAVNGGGMIGKAYRGETNVTSCDVRADFDDVVGGNGSVGGLAGHLGWFNFKDTFAECSANGTTLRTVMAIGGLGGFSEWSGTVVNCGAKVDIQPKSTQGCETYVGGLIGFARGIDMARSYASGTIKMDTTGLEVYSSSINAGGLVGNGATSVTQCYGGVDLDIKRGGSGGLALGSLAGTTQNIVSSWSDTSLNDYTEEDVKNSVVGGLAGSAETVLDSCFVGSIQTSGANLLGGLIGCGGVTIRNCYAKADLLGANFAGGLAADTNNVGSDCFFYDCWFEGNVSASSVAGGIVSCAANLYRCDASGSVLAPDGTVGGIAGTAGVIDDCSFNGTVGGVCAGGILGNGNKVYDSTFQGSLNILMTDGNSNVGGIAGQASWVENCHVLDMLNLYLDNANIGTAYQFAGGIVGRHLGTVTLLNCTNKGLVYHSTNATPPYPAYIGGLAPGWGMSVTAENCKVDGDVVFTGRLAHLRIGGLMGRGGTVMKNCMVTGDVAASISPLEEDGTLEGMSTDVCYIGGLVGEGSGVILDASYHRGSVRTSTTHEGYHFLEEDPLVGGGDFSRQNMPGAPESTRDDENYIIYTYGHALNSQAMLPLPGATVSIDGTVVGTTDDSGMLTLRGSEVSDRSMVKISAAAEGYFECSTVDFLCHGGSVQLILRQKEEGKIYLTSALIETGDGEMQEMLYSRNSVQIMQEEQAAQHCYFGVDWNDTQAAERKLQLVDKNGNARLNLTANHDVFFLLPEIFEPNEEIYLKASGLKQDNTETSTQVLLPLKVKAIKLSSTAKTDEAPVGKTEEKDGLDFLNGISMGANFGDLFKFAGDIKVENGVLTIDFGAQDPISDKDKAKRESNVLLNGRCKVSVGGKLQLNLNATEEDLFKWAGEVYAKAAMSPLLEHSVPLGYLFVATSEINMGGSLAGGMEGNHESATFYGRIGAEGDVSIMIGAGADLSKDWKIIMGPEMGASGGLDYYIEPFLDNPGRFEATLSGALSLKAEVKAGEFFEFEPGFQVGSFKWDNENGAKFYVLGEELEPLATLDSARWMPDTQAYLTAGGGFITAPLRNPAVLYSWNGTPVADPEQLNVAQLYENIAQGSDAALTTENGNLVLWFTADDGNWELDGNVADHTAVWRTVQNADGSWSEPVIVSGSENGYPDNIRANGPAAIWVESTQTGSLEELLTSTQIKVAVNGEVFHTIETGGYAYNAKVSAADDGSNILISWFSAPEVNSLETMMTAEPALCYARYADGVWSQGTVKTGEKIPADATPVYSEPIIAWTDTNGQQYRNARTDFTYNAVWIADLAHAEHNGNFTAEMEEDGTLVIWEGTTQRAKLQTGSAGFEAPLLLDDGNGVYYAVWTENDGIYYADSASGWAYAKPICALEQQVMGLSGAIVDGLPVVTYYQTDYNEDKTDFIYHLYIAQAPDLSAADLAITEVMLDEESVGETGLMTVSAEVVNRGEGVVAGYTYAVTDETGKEYFTGTVSDVSLGYEDADLCHALIAVDVTAQHTYSVTITAEEDINSANNVGAATAQSKPELSAASFQLMTNGEIGLKAVATNAGSAPLAEMTMEIYRCNSDGTQMGDVLAAETFETVCSGSYRQLMLDEVVMDTLYKVVLTSDGEEVDNQMLMWSEPEVSGAWITGVELSEEGVAKVKLSAQNWTENLVLHLAVYDENGRMAANAMESLDAWTGAKSLESDFAEELTGGEYTCSAFLLKRDGLVPVVKKLTDTVVIP